MTCLSFQVRAANPGHHLSADDVKNSIAGLPVNATSARPASMPTTNGRSPVCADQSLAGAASPAKAAADATTNAARHRTGLVVTAPPPAVARGAAMLPHGAREG